MSNLIREKVIVLRKTKYSEADLVIQTLSAKGGKISFLARGALRSKKRFGGGILEPTHHLEVQYKKPSREDALAVLDEAVLLQDFPSLRMDYDRLEMALKVLEIVNKVAQEGDAHAESIYNLTGSALKSLDSNLDISHFKIHFALRFLMQQGVLEQENWMKVFLQTPLAKTYELAETDVDPKYLHWVESRLATYVARAEH